MAQPRNDFTLDDDEQEHVDWTNQVGSRMQETFNVKDFGAVGDGTTDDTTALEAAVTAANAVGVRGVVYFPPGTYYTAHATTQWRVTATGITLRGSGKRSAILKFNEARNTGMTLEGDDLVVEHLGFIGGNTTSTILVEFGAAGRHRNQIRNCRFTAGTADSGIAINVGAGGKEGTLIENNVFDGVYQAVGLIQDNHFTTVRNNTIIGWTFSGIRLTGSGSIQAHATNVLIEGNRLFDPDETGGAGTVGYPIHTEGVGGYHRNVTVTNNFVRGTDKEYALDTGTPDQLSFSNVEGLIVEGNTSIDGGDMGITLEPTVSQFVVANNIVKNNDAAGIWCDAPDGTIVGNTCLNNGQDRSSDISAQIEAGIYLSDDADGVAVSGNRCFDDQGTKTQKYGLSIASGATLVTVEGNQFNGNDTGPYNDLAGVLSVFNVKDYGARGDGVTDDLAAFQSAVTAAENAGGGRVVVPGPDTYVFDFVALSTISSPTRILITTDNIEIVGIGNPTISMEGLTVSYLQSIDDFASSGRDIFTCFSFAGCDGGRVEGIRFVGEYTTNEAFRFASPRAKAVGFLGATNGTVENLYGEDLMGNLVHAVNSNITYDVAFANSEHITMRNCHAVHCHENGFNWQGGTKYGIASDLIAERCRANGLETACENFILNGGLFTANQGSGMAVSGTKTQINGLTSLGNTVDITPDPGKGFGLYISGGSDIQVNGPKLNDNYSFGLYIASGVSDVIVTDPELRNNAVNATNKFAIYLVGTSGSHISNIRILGGVIECTSTVAGAILTYCDDVDIWGMRGVFDTASYAVFAFDTCTNTSVKGNRFNKNVDLQDGGEDKDNHFPNTELVFNVRDYGATGDGTTDDQTAIQAAVTAAIAADGEVFFPPGNYRLASTVTVGSFTDGKISGSGQGSIIEPDAAVTAFQFNSCARVTVRDFQVDGGAVALDVDGATDSFFENLHLVNQTSNGVLVDGDDSTEQHWTDIVIRDCTDTGFKYTRTDTVDTGGMYLTRVRSVGVGGTTNAGFEFSSTAGAVTPSFINLTDCVADNCDVDGCIFDNIAHTEIIGCFFTANSTSPSGSAGLHISDGYIHKITNSYLGNGRSTADAYCLLLDTSAHEVVIDNVIFDGDATNGTGIGWSGAGSSSTLYLGQFHCYAGTIHDDDDNYVDAVSRTGLLAYSDTSRPSASGVRAGTMIWNTDDTAPNFSDGSIWRDAAGTAT